MKSQSEQAQLLVAVFGHQRKGCDNESYMRGAEYIGLGTVSGFSLYLDGGLPVVRRSERGRGSSVVVDIFKVTLEVLARLDICEGYCPAPDGNTDACATERVQVIVHPITKTPDNEIYSCFLYVYKLPVFNNAIRIHDGDLISYLGRRHE